MGKWALWFLGEEELEWGAGFLRFLGFLGRRNLGLPL
jgi:hypothetical protein